MRRRYPKIQTETLPKTRAWANPPHLGYNPTREAMEVTMRLPNDIYESLKSRWDDVPRHALEALAAEAYRSGALTETQVKRLLGFETRFQVHALLKEHRVPYRFSGAEIESDLDAQRDLGILPQQ